MNDYKNKFSKFLFWFLFFGFIFLVILKNNLSFLDPDLGWHLRVGKDLLANHIFSRFDIYTNSYFGFPWIAHSWFSEIISFSIYNSFGYLTLAIFYSLLATLIFVVSYLTIKKIDKVNNLTTFIIVLFGLFCFMVFVSIRMQIFSYLGFALVMYLLSSYWRNKNNTIYFMPLIFMLMANLHGAFAIGLIPFLLMAIFNKDKKLLLIFSLALAATLINPYGVYIWQEVWQTIFSSELKNYIIEWLPLFSYPANFLGVVFLIFLIISLLKYSRKFPSWYILFVGLVIVAAILAKKYMPYLIISSLPILASALNELLEKFAITNKIADYRNLITIIIIPFIGLLLAVSIAIISVKNLDPFLDQNSKIYPSRALEYLKINYPSPRMFNLLSWGGYILWKSDYQVFFDGRMIVWQNNNITPFEEYKAIFDAQDNWVEIVDKYQIDTVLIPQKREVAFWIQPNWFNKLLFKKMLNQPDFGEVKIKKELEKSSSWKKVYEDEISVVFVRN